MIDTKKVLKFIVKEADNLEQAVTLMTDLNLVVSKSQGKRTYTLIKQGVDNV